MAIFAMSAAVYSLSGRVLAVCMATHAMFGQRSGPGKKTAAHVLLTASSSLLPAQHTTHRCDADRKITYRFTIITQSTQFLSSKFTYHLVFS